MNEQWARDMDRDQEQHPERWGMVIDDHGNPVAAPAPETVAFVVTHQCGDCGALWRGDAGAHSCPLAAAPAPDASRFEQCDDPTHASVIYEAERGYRVRRTDCADCARALTAAPAPETLDVGRVHRITCEHLIEHEPGSDEPWLWPCTKFAREYAADHEGEPRE